MNRRESLKTFLVGSIGGATLATTAGCQPEEKATEEAVQSELPLYGRTPEEIERDKEVMADIFLTEPELETIAVLCDIILPATETAGSAGDAGVPEFIEFIVKDIPSHQLPIRGGLMWLNGESNRRFNTVFKDCTNEQQIEIIDDIAYPDPENKKPDMAYGIKFFNRMRNLTVTGYYTTKMGIDDLGYKGNFPNVWDGVPEEVLKEHEVDYDADWLAKCVDQSKRMEVAKWDDEGNLIS